MRAGRAAYFIIIGLVLGFAVSHVLLASGAVESVVVVNDRDYFPVAYSLISSANSSVHVLMFEAKYYSGYPDSLSNMLLEKIAEKSGQVDVKVYIDSLFNQSRSGYEFLKSRGVDIRYGIPGRVSHAKLVIVDGKYVLVGSTNWGYYSLEKNHEANVLIISDSIGSQFERYFSSVWESAG